MNYRRLGSAGLKVSEISLGTWVTFGQQVQEAAAFECVSAAYEAGVNFFDTAESYAAGRAEIVLGHVLKKSGWRRSSYVVSTKFFWGLHDRPNERNTLSRKRLIEGIAGSLKRLQLEYVDLIFCHRPDPETPIEETVRAMTDIVRRGQALYWGTSEWSAEKIVQAYQIARQWGLYPPQMEQPEYNMFNRERVEKEYAPLYQDYGLGTTIWSPLAYGILTGKYNSGIPVGSRAALAGYEWVKDEVTPERIAKVNELRPVAAGLGCTIAQLALAWCLKNRDVSTVITGASRLSQVQENVRAAGVAERLTPDVMERIEAILDARPQADGG